MKDKTVLDVQTGIIKASLGRENKILVDQVAFSLFPGESLGLMGETGSGKTMTALSVMGLLPENVRQEGSHILFHGEPLQANALRKTLLGNKIAYIPQSGAECLNPSRKIKNQLIDGMKKNSIPRGQWKEKGLELLSQAGLDKPKEVWNAYPFALSGGMAQKVTIALAACGEPDLILADEPTNGLDAASTEGFFDLLGCMFPKAAKLVITHDMSVARHCDRVIVLCKGKMCESGPAEEVLREPRHPYTKALIMALTENGLTESPMLRSGEGACPFYARCPQATELCLKEQTHRQEENREWWCSGQTWKSMA